MSHLIGGVPVPKATIIPAGGRSATRSTFPRERFLHTGEEFIDPMKIYLRGAAEQIIFGRLANGAPNDLEEGDRTGPRDGLRVRDVGTPRLEDVRADNYALSEETKTVAIRSSAAHRRGLSRRIRLTTSTVPRWIGSPRICSRRRRSAPTMLVASADIGPESQAGRRRRAGCPTEAHVTEGAASRGSRTVQSRSRSSPRRGGAWIHHIGSPRGSRRGFTRTAGPSAPARGPRRGGCTGSRGCLNTVSAAGRATGALGEDTPVGKFLSNGGPGCTTLLFKVADLRRELSELAARASS